MKQFRYIQPILVISISVLVLLICVIAIAGVWMLEEEIESAAIAIFEGVDVSAKVMRNGIGRVDTGLVRLGDTLGEVEQVLEDLALNVNHKGIVFTLLPPAREQELTNAVQSVQENFHAIQDLLVATSEMLRKFDNIPFVDTPEKLLATVKDFQERTNDVEAQVEQLKTGIGEFRSGASTEVSRIITATTRLNDQLDVLRSDLAVVDSDLNNIQDQSRNLQRLTPTVLLFISIFVTLFGIWVAYSQVVVIDRSLKRYRENINQETELGADESQESLLDEETPSASEIVETADSAHVVVDQNVTSENERKDDSST